MAGTVSNKSLDDVFSAMPTGSLERAILNNLRGINHRQIPGMLPSNRDMPGLTFFTRPQLNMQRDNLRNVRKLSQLLTNVPTSMQTYIRCMLDPRLVTGVSFKSSESSNATTIPAISCPIIDNMSAFIPFLTNNTTSQSGWPSISVPTFTSKPGLYNEAYSMVDGRVVNEEVWDLNVNFRNTRGDPILYMFYVWVLYMSFVFEGKLVPYLDFITENEIDYNTRIYRITLDYAKRKVTKMAATHASFPVGVPIGDPFNVSGDQVYSDANQEIGMSFRCHGVDYFDDILVKEFNETVALFNPSMSSDYRSKDMLEIPFASINSYNHQGYPYIDPKTSELKWFITQKDYTSTSGKALAAVTEYNSDEETGD